MTASADPLALPKDAQDLLFREARSANAFGPGPIPEEKLRAVHDLVKYGPTAMNTQPLRVLLLRSAESRARLLPLLAEGNRAKTEAAPLTAVLAYDADFHEKAEAFFPDRAEMVRGAFADAAARPAAASLNAHLQAGYLLVGVRAAGLAAGPMNGFDHAGVDAEFFAGSPLHSFMVVNIGEPAGPHAFPRLPRLEYGEVWTEL
ncbi:malonic semialdehyde reductase [Nocardiopsis chromatogenes]|uniref:malonic semialdehyde reductase n=1 Tax=Nocardiopsis chromatogenes TaxID=280239 RepID=UPI000347F09F|nr:malonic semialdehyde reductase [Nocardiopsis chromatogenes]